ncbi:hypothetical protein FUMI01_21590 [Flavobacterium sp. UMI-01]|nr:hypothetical protein FUMI01_21590 [Flavobacterium sp. UMI-01]
MKAFSVWSYEKFYEIRFHKIFLVNEKIKKKAANFKSSGFFGIEKSGYFLAITFSAAAKIA